MSVMVALDGGSKWDKAPYDLLRGLGKAGCTNFKFHEALPGLDLKASISVARKVVLPGQYATIMLDDKKHDVSSTCIRAIHEALSMQCDLVTVHASGGRKMLSEIVGANAQLANHIVAVTVLTSMPESDVYEIYNASRREATIRLATIAAEYGIWQFVCGFEEVPVLKEILPRVLSRAPRMYTPGIRPEWFTTKTDQTAATTPKRAKEIGADVLILGRPILSSDNPGEAFQKISEEIR